MTFRANTRSRQRGFLLNPARFASGGGGGGDPYFPNVVALLHLDGTDGSTTFADEIGHSFSAVGGAELDTAQQKFGDSALLLNGSNACIATPTSTDWDYGSDPFTIEMWLRLSTAPTQRGALYHRGAGAELYFEVSSNGRLRAVANGGTISVDDALATDITKAVWHHCALTNDGSNLRTWLDGVMQGESAIGVPLSTSTDPLRIGADTGNSRYVIGHIDEARITKGICRYASTFTPPAAPFPDS